MPITPFHFGPGTAVKAVVPNLFSLTAFIGANVLIDVEPFYYMLTNQYPVHRFFHTYVGATVITLVVILVILLLKRLVTTFSSNPLWAQRELKFLPVLIGAALGGYSHIVLDSIMHIDIRPLAPFSDGNTLFRVISLPKLHLFCLILGGLGVVGLLARSGYRKWSKS
ncbi:MAG: DUF4184 family protein [Nitrospirales bacterium]|nr:DUF4184 family protein [Nitrospirales bacterium]MDR4485411.1 DUF4184 family protein [Nitrospirales bacterium]